jgi:hypothetical protein
MRHCVYLLITEPEKRAFVQDTWNVALGNRQERRLNVGRSHDVDVLIGIVDVINAASGRGVLADVLFI